MPDSETFNVKLPKALIAKLRRLAKAEGRTQTWLVQTFIREGFQRREQEQKRSDP